MDETLFDLVMQHDPNLVFVKDENSVLLWANPALLAVYPPERRDRIIGFTTVEEFSAEEASLWLAGDRKALAEGRSEIIETIVDWTGRTRIFLSRKTAFTTRAGEKRLLGISTDITELADRERRLVETNDRLQRFSAMAAHDLRSPLATFATAMTMIRGDRNSTLSASARVFMDGMISSATSLSQNISALLAAARAETDRGSEFERCDVNLLLEEAKFNLSSEIERTGFAVYSNRMPTLTAEPTMIRQLFQNLIENSIKYRASHAPQIYVTYRLEDGRHVFLFEDNGPGVSAKAAARIFDMFDQGDRAGAPGSGSGIGLALCKQVAHVHGGRIGLDQNAEFGCRIVFELPVDASLPTRSIAA